MVIVGGGPAGMKAAMTAYDRGHQVTLLEKKVNWAACFASLKKAHKEKLSGF